MKACILILVSMLWTATLGAEPPKQAPQPSKSEGNLGELTVQKPIQLEKALAPEDAWTEARHGVIGQFIEAPNLLAPINPLAKAEAGWGDANLSRDTVTGRIMGLRLLKIEF